MKIKTKLVDNCPEFTKLEIENYDAWNLDSTLAPIILALLKNFKGKYNGAPHVENCDVPEHLQAPPGFDTADSSDCDENYFARFGFILDEMIWAFEQIVNKPESEEQFHHGNWHRLWQAIDADGHKIGEPFELGDGSEYPEAEHFEMIKADDDTSWFDRDGFKAHQERVVRGTTLFGKYFQSLWW